MIAASMPRPASFEYWQVEPKNPRIIVLVLHGAAYRRHGVYGSGGTTWTVAPATFIVQIDESFTLPQEASE